MHRVMVIAAVGLLPLAAASASMAPIPGEERFAGLVPSDQQSLAAELGYAKMGEDHFVRLVLNTELNLGQVGLGLQVPLNLRVMDKDPKNDNDFYGLVRREDWDEGSEFLKVIRYVRLGHKRDDFFLRVGELAADLGHGTIMNRYLNNLDIDTFRVGTSFDVNTRYGGVETVIGDLGTFYDSKSPESRLLGGRLHFKPLSLADPDGLLNVFAIGATVVTDLNAPETYRMAQQVKDGVPQVDPVTGQPVMVRDVNSRGNLVPESTTRALVWGIDAEVEVLHNAVIDLVPYTDLNFLNGGGWGWHAGVLTTFKMPIGIALTIPVRLEYRRFEADYAPAFFNTFYEVERYSYLSSGGGAGIEPDPKVVAVKKGGGGALSGYYADLAFDLMGLVQVGAMYEDYEGGNPNLQAFAAVPAMQTVQLKAYYARTGIRDTEDIFKLDERSMGVAEGRYELFTFVYLVGRLTRRWVLDEDGKYKANDDWKVGIEASLTF